jgi:hypothetical protein
MESCGHVRSSSGRILSELVNLVKDSPYPILICRDYNLPTFPREKNKDKGRFNNHCFFFLFSVVIDRLDLREVLLIIRYFTRKNNFPQCTYDKLDRVPMT